jgi:peptide/nickel transport system substrate-binding protein
VEATITLKHYADYPDMADRWVGFGKPMLASAVVEGPGIVKVGEEAAFDVTITFEDQPYPNAKLESVTYWVTDATGALVDQGNAEAVEDGMYKVVLPTDITAKLTAGSNKLSVAVSSKAVSIPAFATVEFVTQ